MGFGSLNERLDTEEPSRSLHWSPELPNIRNPSSTISFLLSDLKVVAVLPWLSEPLHTIINQNFIYLKKHDTLASSLICVVTKRRKKKWYVTCSNTKCNHGRLYKVHNFYLPQALNPIFKPRININVLNYKLNLPFIQN